MIKEAMEWIASHAKPDVFRDQDERKFLVKHIHQTEREIMPSEPESRCISSLDGLIDFTVREQKKGEHGDGLVLHVESYNKVTLHSDLSKLHRKREFYADCQPVRFSQFSFDRYMDIEDFIIQVQCRFMDTEFRAELIKSVSGISASRVVTSEDDGVSQVVATKDEVNRLQETKLDPIILLRPHRTFPELEQPRSPFLLRLKARKDELPEVALFEADGGRWKIEAMKLIEDYLIENQPDSAEYQVIR